MIFFLRFSLTIIILLTVLFQVSSAGSDFNQPIITPSNDYAIDGKDYNLTCDTSESTTSVIWQRGRAFIKQKTLNCSGEDISFTDQQRAHLYKYFCANNKTFTLSIPGSIIVDEHETKWICTGKDPSAQFRIYVYHASHEEPHISGYNNLQDILEGESINLTCTVSGGYPLTFLSWTCNDILMNSSNQSTKIVAKIVLPLLINRTLHRVQCVCNGTSLANYSGSSTVTFKVNYPPSVTLIDKKEKNSNTTNNNLYCQVDDGNPSKYAISWSHTFSKRVVRTNQDLSNLQSNNGHNLTLKGASYQDIGEYTCSAHNNVTDLNGNLLQNKSVTIKRNFSAVFSPANDKVFNAVYGKTFNVRILFYCQPAINNIGDLLWFKKKNEEQLLNQSNDLTFSYGKAYVEIQFYQTSIRVDGQVAIMNIKKISNTSQGNFVLKVRNMEDVYESFEFKIKVKEEMKDSTTTGTSTKGPGQKSSLPLFIGCVVTAISIVAVVVVVVVLYMIRTRKFNKDKDEKQRFSENITGNRELYRVSNPYAEVTETNAQTARPSSNPYSEPNIGQPAHNYDINTTSKDKQYNMAVCPYAVTGSVQWLCTGPVNSDILPIATVSPYAEIGMVQKPGTGLIKKGSVKKEDTNAENNPVPIYAEVNKHKKNVNTNSEVGAIYSSDSQKVNSNDVKKPDPVYSEVKKPRPSKNQNKALDSKEQTEQVDEEGAAKHSSDSQKGDIKNPDPVNSEAKKPKPIEKKDEAIDCKELTEQASGVGAAKDSHDAHKDNIMKPDPINSEAKKSKPIEKKDDAFDSKDRTEQVSEVGATKGSNDVYKDNIMKPDPVKSEAKKSKPSKKMDEALESKEQAKHVDEEGAVKHYYDSQKGYIKKPYPVNSEAKKPKPREKKDEALESKEQADQENNKVIDAVDQDGNRLDSRSDVVPNSTSLSTVNDTVVECEGETTNELNYVELDLSQQSDQKFEIISKEEKVEYAEVNTMA